MMDVRISATIPGRRSLGVYFVRQYNLDHKTLLRKHSCPENYRHLHTSILRLDSIVVCWCCFVRLRLDDLRLDDLRLQIHTLLSLHLLRLLRIVRILHRIPVLIGFPTVALVVVALVATSCGNINNSLGVRAKDVAMK